MFSLDHKIKYYLSIKYDLKKFNFPKIRTNKRIVFYNIPCSFDIETTSFRDAKNEKKGIMYEWTFGIDGYVYYGRTWKEYKELLEIIADYLDINQKQRLVIYVHNLAFEFQFMRKHFKWDKIFAVNERTPLFCIDDIGFEYRCSLQLSGYSLNSLGNNLTKYKVNKLVGDLDYSLLRHSNTPLTDKELGYCENDVKVVMAYIQEKLERGERIPDIPYTKTGYVRNYCRKKCFYNGYPRKSQNGRRQFQYYRTIMEMLELDPEEYKMLVRAYQGGFTHANPLAAGKEFKNVSSYDFTSSYPTCIVAEKYPMSRGKEVKINSQKEFDSYLENYCCLFDIEIFGLRPRLWYDNPISKSRCWSLENIVENNGRIVYADHLKTTLTEQDYFIIKDFYNWDKIKIGKFIFYHKWYLPTAFVESVLKLYQDKTMLKGVEGREVEYSASKEMLNSTYGMCVTSIVRDGVEYENNEWIKKPVEDFEKQIEKNNNSFKRFLFYGWGVWITAYARRNLFSGIKACGTDYLYSDTDSLKILNKDNHQKYFEEYNKEIKNKLYKACEHHNIDISYVCPKNVKGTPKMLGVWDYEGDYDKFKTLGAKRYMYLQSNELHITISGLGKTTARDYLENKYHDNVFEAFDNNMNIPKGYSGRMTHTYIDNEQSGTMIDYLGNSYNYHELSSVHLEDSEFTMALSEQYLKFLLDIKEMRGGY